MFLIHLRSVESFFDWLQYWHVHGIYVVREKANNVRAPVP